ncbi:hypothetical protein BD408DRAFT_438616, partial [Parasitella parasitica]
DAHLDADKEPDSLNISGVALEILQQLEEIKRLINAGMTEISEKQKAAHKEAQLFQQRILDIVSGNNVPITSHVYHLVLSQPQLCQTIFSTLLAVFLFTQWLVKYPQPKTSGRNGYWPVEELVIER